MDYKNILLLLCFFTISKSNAQALLYHPHSLEVYKNSAKWVTVIDHINDVKLKPGTDTTLLFIGGYFPGQVLTVVIKGADKKFQGYPVSRWPGKDATISGNIVFYEGKPAIIVKDSSQINIATTAIVNH
ncbi:hypothetical protein BDD43_1704 [Mucilaginibacter gracilis]|uniref:Uncharacterized protein n=1 Tax=Mucilaginibacter gracilis TaxID=423350 RepID=A0A495IXY1_9SPHI|nr:hypothetical protein [Mucilaginibacter gracilis]RKR81557.1 hypothetical protein BDD43_1704 [Mucilaginibacter gracilis]